MSNFVLRRLALCLPLTLVSAASGGEPMALRLGAWEVSTVLEDSPTRVVVRACMTKADLTPFVHGPDTIEDDPCWPTDPARSSRRQWSISLSCQDGSRIHSEFTLVRPEEFSGAMVRLGGKAQRLHRAEINGRWLGADCRGVR